MVVHKLFLNCAVETLTMSVHLGRFRIGMIMGNVVFLQKLIQMFLELAAVVGKDIFDFVRKELPDQIKEVSGGF